MMILGYLLKIRSVQIPINYKKRVGSSSVTGDVKKAFFLGIKMIILIFSMRFKINKFIVKILEKI